MLLEDIGPDDEKSLGEMLLLDNEEVDDDDLLIWELDAWYTDTDHKNNSWFTWIYSIY